jgi:hypothetical protein
MTDRCGLMHDEQPDRSGRGTVEAHTMTSSPEAQEPMPREPVGGAGLYDVDPPQGDLSQDPDVPVVGDADALPEDMEL